MNKNSLYTILLLNTLIAPFLICFFNDNLIAYAHLIIMFVLIILSLFVNKGFYEGRFFIGDLSKKLLNKAKQYEAIL